MNTYEGKKAKLNSIIEDFESIKSTYDMLKEETNFEEAKVYHDVFKDMLDDFNEVFIEFELLHRKQENDVETQNDSMENLAIGYLLKILISP